MFGWIDKWIKITRETFVFLLVWIYLRHVTWYQQGEPFINVEIYEKNLCSVVSLHLTEELCWVYPLTQPQEFKLTALGNEQIVRKRVWPSPLTPTQGFSRWRPFKFTSRESFNPFESSYHYAPRNFQISGYI